MTETTPRTIVLTGVTRGIGRALAEHLAAAGHTVVGCGRAADEIAKLTASLGDPHGFTAVDVADADAVARWAADVVERWGAPDLLINNAALINENAPLWRVSAAEMDALLAVNVSGTANTVRSFVPAMIERGTGIVVNMSSGWGRSTSPEVGPYCTTKWAVEGFTSALAQELPAGLAAVAVSPGMIDTEMLRSCWGDEAANHPSPAEWAPGAARFLLALGTKDNGGSLTIG